MRPLWLLVVAGLAGLALTALTAELRAPKPTDDARTRAAVVELWNARIEAEIPPSCDYFTIYPDPSVLVDCHARGIYFEHIAP